MQERGRPSKPASRCITSAETMPSCSSSLLIASMRSRVALSGSAVGPVCCGPDALLIVFGPVWRPARARRARVFARIDDGLQRCRRRRHRHPEAAEGLADRAAVEGERQARVGATGGGDWRSRRRTPPDAGGGSTSRVASTAPAGRPRLARRSARAASAGRLTSPPFWSSLAALENVTGVSAATVVRREMETGQRRSCRSSRVRGRPSATTHRGAPPA